MHIELHGFLPEHVAKIMDMIRAKAKNMTDQSWQKVLRMSVVETKVYDIDGNQQPFYRLYGFDDLEIAIAFLLLPDTRELTQLGYGSHVRTEGVLCKTP